MPNRADNVGAKSAAERREERLSAADYHASRLAQQRAAETARARALITDFVQETHRRNLAPQRLKAWPRSGATRRYPTDLTGWYVRRDHRAAVGSDGEFYLLTVDVPARFRWQAWRSVPVVPTPPRLVLGMGGRDGESVDLAVALARVLAEHPASRK